MIVINPINNLNPVSKSVARDTILAMHSLSLSPLLVN
jgi:hypothetical protein